MTCRQPYDTDLTDREWEHLQPLVPLGETGPSSSDTQQTGNPQTASSTQSAAEVPGSCCRMICRRGELSTTTSGHGGAMVLGRRFTTVFEHRCGEQWAAIPNRAVPSLTASRCGPANKVAANVQDRAAARVLLGMLATRFRRLRVVWADGAYAGGALQHWIRRLRPWEKCGSRLFASQNDSMALQSCRGAGLWNERLHGWADGVASRRTTSACRKTQKHSFTLR
jgi:transposase